MSAAPCAEAALSALVELRGTLGDTTVPPSVAALGAMSGAAASQTSSPNLHALAHVCWVLAVVSARIAHPAEATCLVHAVPTALLASAALAFPDVTTCPRDSSGAPLAWRVVAPPLGAPDGAGDVPSTVLDRVCASMDAGALLRLTSAASEAWRRDSGGGGNGKEPQCGGNALVPYAVRVCLSLTRRASCFSLATTVAAADSEARGAYHTSFVPMARAGRLGWDEDGAGEPLLDTLGDAVRGASDVAPTSLIHIASAAEACVTGAVTAQDGDASLLAWCQLEGVLRTCVPCVPKRAHTVSDAATRRVAVVCTHVARLASGDIPDVPSTHLPPPSCAESCFQTIGTLCGFLADLLMGEDAEAAGVAFDTLTAPVRYFAAACTHAASWRNLNGLGAASAQAYRTEWFRRARRASTIALIRILETRKGGCAATLLARGADIGAALSAAMVQDPPIDPPLRGGQEPTRRVVLRCMACCSLARKEPEVRTQEISRALAIAEAAASSSSSAADVPSALDELSVALEGAFAAAASCGSVPGPAAFADHAAEAALACLTEAHLAPVVLGTGDGRRALRTLLCALVGCGTRMSVDGLLAAAPRGSPAAAFSGFAPGSPSPMDVVAFEPWSPPAGACVSPDVDSCVSSRVKAVLAVAAEGMVKMPQGSVDDSSAREEVSDALLTLLHTSLLAFPRCIAFVEAARTAAYSSLRELSADAASSVPLSRLMSLAAVLLRTFWRGDAADEALLSTAVDAACAALERGVAGDDARAVLLLIAAVVVRCSAESAHALGARTVGALTVAARTGRIPPSHVSDAAEALRCGWSLAGASSTVGDWVDSAVALSTGDNSHSEVLGSVLSDAREFKKRFKTACGGKRALVMSPAAL